MKRSDNLRYSCLRFTNRDTSGELPIQNTKALCLEQLERRSDEKSDR